MPLNHPNQQFNLDHQYGLYLERVNLKEAEMHPVQRIETKRAFMGAIGQMLVLFRDDIPEYPDDEAVSIMEDLWEQAVNYWKAQV